MSQKSIIMTAFTQASRIWAKCMVSEPGLALTLMSDGKVYGLMTTSVQAEVKKNFQTERFNSDVLSTEFTKK